MRLFGWKLWGAKPKCDSYVLIAAPHTSNLDFILMILFAWAFEMNVTWMGKHTLFTPPMGWIMRLLGGMPIDRRRSGNVVDAMVDAFAENPTLVLVVPAEGTRSRQDYWKSGFYHIARRVGVPIVPSILDFGQMRGGFGPVYELTGDVSKDMDFFREFYDGIEGRFPELFSPVRLREEDEA